MTPPTIYAVIRQLDHVIRRTKTTDPVILRLSRDEASLVWLWLKRQADTHETIIQ